MRCPPFIALLFAVGCETTPPDSKPTPKDINQISNIKIGTPIWGFKTGGVVVFSPSIGSDGTVYVGSGDKLYAIKTDSKRLAKSPWPMRGQNARHTDRVMKK